MWVVSGPFDGIQDGVKEKLLKPGKTYTVGRAKNGQSPIDRLNIDNKAVSHEHLDIIVGPYELDDVSDVQARPTVRMVVRREKDIWVNTPTQRVAKGISYDVESGDEIGVTNKISVYVLWKPIIAVNADGRIKKERLRQVAAESAKLGITVAKSWMDTATHFITQSINMSRRPLHSLMLGVSLVDVQWLDEVFRRGNALSVESGPDEHGVAALESHFVLPSEKDFRPQLAGSEDEDEDVTGWPVELWDADPRRKTMWTGLQFHFFCDDTAPTEWTDQAQLGGATFKSHNFNPELAGDRITDVDDANALFQGIRLSAGKLGKVSGMKSPVVIVVRPSEVIAALGKAIWKAFQEGMQNNGFKYVTPKDVTYAVLKVDATLVDCGLDVQIAPSLERKKLKKNTTMTSATSLPSNVPPTDADEMSITGPVSVTTASTSRIEELPEVSEPAPEPPRPRLLKRRLRSESREPSAAPVPPPPAAAPVVPVAIPEGEEPVKAESVIEPPRPRLLKRRVKTSTIAEVLGLDDSNASIDPRTALAEPAKPAPPLTKSVAIELDTADLPPSTPAQTHAPAVPRTNRLKRRADVLAERTTIPAVPEEVEPREEPALKRYRQLFEGTQRAATAAPLRAIDDSHDDESVLGPTVVEEVTTRKRKSADRDKDSDVEMAESAQPKRRTVGSGVTQQTSESYVEPNLESQLPEQSQVHPGIAHTRTPGVRGAVPGAPDKDTALLDALSQKEKEQPAATTSKSGKGKAAATPIDKEFANMRIAQANEQEEASRRRAEEMRVWEECERNVDVRGNFMVIELVDLVRRNRGHAVRSINPAWGGKPDFKKFKKKLTGPRGPRVQVFADNDDELDYGLGENYWEQKPALGESGAHSGDMSRLKPRVVQDDDSDTPIPQTLKSNRARPAAQTTAIAGPSSRAEPKAKPKPRNRRIAVELSDEFDEDDLSRIKFPGTSAAAGKRRAMPSSARKTNLADFGMRDDDSEEESGRGRSNGICPDEDTFSSKAADEDAVSHMVGQEPSRATPVAALSHMSSLGSASLGVRKPAMPSSSTAKRAKAPPKKVVVIDSDSDGGGFKGFGTKRRKRGAAPPSS
ncbi:hypothetical protein BDV93DRAFT_140859 [Ceratobasidium sp. AG-I]|nr:hypothetical protein BDV93DRAFT_140859 [Ceratobasidium sp. AG-I]